MLAIDVLFDESLLDGSAPSEEGRIEGESVAVYEFDGDEDGASMRHRLYVCSRNGLPVRFSTFTPGSSGEWVEEARVDFSDWDLDVSLPDSLFDPTPPPDAKPAPARKPWFDPGLKSGMPPSPLNSADLAGKAVSLAATVELLP